MYATLMDFDLTFVAISYWFVVGALGLVTVLLSYVAALQLNCCKMFTFMLYLYLLWNYSNREESARADFIHRDEEKKICKK